MPGTASNSFTNVFSIFLSRSRISEGYAAREAPSVGSSWEGFERHHAVFLDPHDFGIGKHKIAGEVARRVGSRESHGLAADLHRNAHVAATV
jgi:hypothetical protein